MAFRVDEKRRKLPFLWRKWNPLISQTCHSLESAESWIAQLERCDRNFGYFTEYRIVEVDNS